MSNIGFVGKEGFPWWLGQVSSEQTEQSKGEGWGDRYKVRILGYHSADSSELPDSDLPYAIAMLPTTTGTGGAGFAQNSRLRPGDTCVGFFLDGDNAQQPIIMGALTRTPEVSTSGTPGNYVPGSAETDNVESPPTESAGQDKKAAPTEVDHPLAGLTYTPANTCKDSDKALFTEVIGVIDNLLAVSSEATNFISDVQSAAIKLQKVSNNLVGDLMSSLYDKLIPLLKDGLDKLYQATYATTLGATQNPVLADEAGTKAQEAMVPAIKATQDALQCVSAKVINSLGNVIKDLLETTIFEVVTFGVCAAEQFVGSLLNNIIDEITAGLGSVINGLAKILDPAFKVEEFLRSSADVAKKIEAFFACNQTGDKCNIVPTWTIGYGAANREIANNAMDSAFDNMNTAKNVTYNKPNCAEPSSCGAPQVKFFGGNGVGGAGKAILGSVVSNTEGLSEVTSSIARTGSIIGVEITDPGEGYTYAPPIVTFEDSCGLGRGAVGRAVVDYDTGKITGVYIVSEGENYPVEDDDEYTVTDTTILESGLGYSSDDTAVDDNGNEYNLTVNNGKIISVTPINNVKVDSLPKIKVNTSTGIGALIRPLMGPFTPQGEVVSVIDCVS